jgi:hypothetical protein
MLPRTYLEDLKTKLVQSEEYGRVSKREVNLIIRMLTTLDCGLIYDEGR